MGNKRITEKDFWMCTNGAMPAQLQGTNKSTKKQSGEKYITIQDKATSSWIDFGCTKLMLIYALLAAAVVVIAALTVATGGAALIALGALAGLAGAAWGAVAGSMLCGHRGAKIREWIKVPKDKQTLIQGVEQVTGDYKMSCKIPGGMVTFAPKIKSWSQAISLGASNYLGKLMEGMMAGAAIGMGGAALSGGAGAFASGGIRGLGQAAFQFAKSAPLNIIKNIGATFGISAAGSSTTTVVTTAATAIGLRSLTATQAGLKHYGSTGKSGWGAAGRGVFGMEEGMLHSGANILSGNAEWQDVAGLALLLSPVHKAPEELNAKKSEPIQDGEPARDGENIKTDEENVKDINTKPDETINEQRDHETYEAAVVRIELVTGDPPFKRNSTHDVAEFQRQIENQEAGLNKLTVEEFINNRDAYLENGRSSEGSAAQQRYREQARADKIREYREQGYTRDEANRMADDYMSDKAALHDPDQVAGGRGDNITGLGDKRVNSSLGSQWKTRIGEIDAKIREQAANMTPEQRANTYLNIKLPWK